MVAMWLVCYTPTNFRWPWCGWTIASYTMASHAMHLSNAEETAKLVLVHCARAVRIKILELCFKCFHLELLRRGLSHDHAEFLL